MSLPINNYNSGGGRIYIGESKVLNVQGHGRAVCYGPAVAYNSPVLVSIPRISGNTSVSPIVVDLAPFQTTTNTGTLAWSLIDAPVGVAIDAATGVLTVVQGVSVQSVGSIYVRVTGVASSAQYPIEFDITAYNPPVLEAIPKISGTTSSAPFTVNLAPFQTASDTGPLTWSLIGAPTGVAIDAATGVLIVAQGVSVASIGLIFAQVTGIASAQQPLDFEVFAYNPPVLAIPPQFGTTSHVALILALGKFQTETNTGPLTWSLTNAPSTVSINSSTGDLTIASRTTLSQNIIVNVVGGTNMVVTQTVSFQIGFAMKVKSVQLRARPGHPERAVVCSEVQLFNGGTWVRPNAGYVTTAAPGHSSDWRVLDNNSNGGTFVHTDVTSPNNAIVLYYPDVPADRISLWIRTDVPAVSGADRMYNVDVEVYNENNVMIWKKELNSTLFNAAGLSYSLSFLT